MGRGVSLPSGANMPVLGFGTGRMKGQLAYAAVARCIEAGYRHVDTAAMYGNEFEVGRAIRDSGISRSKIFVTTKLAPDDADDPAGALRGSLATLGTDHLDLWLIHWPPQPPRRNTSVAVWQSFVEAQQAGLVRDIGVSNFGEKELDELTETTGVTPAVNQVKWSPFDFDSAFLREMRCRGVVLEGYAPLMTSDLDNTVLNEIGRSHDVTSSQVVLRWHVQHGVVVIPKSATPSRISHNVNIFDFELTAEEMMRIDALGQ